MEQWGYSTSTGVTFPIAFRECYAVVSNAHSNTTGNADHYHL
ncbi:gp53-like domain-containing protein, partial [Phascolarctobacterium faecium]